MKNIKVKTWLRLVVTFVFIGLALFLLAGTIDYWRAWIYLGIVAISSVFLTSFMTRDPILLENRSKAGPTAEKRPIQKVIVSCTLLSYVAALFVSALDRRFGWSSVPPYASVFGDLLIVASLWLVYRVFKENSFASATIEIGKNQKVISTGPYAIVRNPMYASAVVYLIGMSLALGSYWSLVASVLAILGLVVRLLDEEQFLSRNLPGYIEYCAKVRWHLIPRVF